MLEKIGTKLVGLVERFFVFTNQKKSPFLTALAWMLSYVIGLLFMGFFILKEFYERRRER